MTVVVRADVAVSGFSVHVNCQMDSGVTAFVGPSGSGKSLTLAAIAGLVRPVSGFVDIDGVRVSDTGTHVKSQDRRIGMVFQSPSLLDHRSPFDNLMVAVLGKKKAERREISMQWLQRVGAEHLAHKDTRRLSGGERQRVSLARALVNGSTTLLLDEPFTALDRESRSKLRELVSEIVDTEVLTAVIVTHDVDDIVAMAHHAVMFEPGSTVGSFGVDRHNPGAVLDILGHR